MFAAVVVDSVVVEVAGDADEVTIGKLARFGIKPHTDGVGKRKLEYHSPPDSGALLREQMPLLFPLTGPSHEKCVHLLSVPHRIFPQVTGLSA